MNEERKINIPTNSESNQKRMCHSIVQKETKLFRLLFDLHQIRIRTIEFSSRRGEGGGGILLERWLS